MLELGALRLGTVKHLVLDEADEMLSMGFRKEVVRIVELTSSRRSTWLFSATFPDKIKRLITDSMSGSPKLPDQVAVSQAHAAFRPDGSLSDDKQAAKVKNLGAQLARHLAKLLA